MKYIFFLILIPQFSTAQDKSGDFKITVEMPYLKGNHKVYLEYYNSLTPDNPQITDSIESSDQKFKFKGIVHEPAPARIYWYQNEPRDSAYYAEMFKYAPFPDSQRVEMINEFLNNPLPESFEFFLVAGEISIKATRNLYGATVDGPNPVLDFEKLKKDDREYSQKRMTMADNLVMMAAMAKKDSVQMGRVMKKMDSLRKRMQDDVYIRYLRENPGSPVAVYALQKGMGNKIDSANKYLQLFYLLSPEIQKWSTAKSLHSLLEASLNAEIGRLVKDFIQFDSLGKQVSFSSFRGKYVLLDLWANWCGPCRTKHPELVKTFQKYQKEKFTILGIALERKEDKKKWLKAIKDDKLLWPQVTDFKFWKNDVARHFGVQSIPYNLLVDPDGRIIDKNLSAEELDRKLGEIFKK